MKKQIIYPKFIPRLFATTLDLFLLSFVSTPITTFVNYKLSSFFFKMSMHEIVKQNLLNDFNNLPEVDFSNFIVYLIILLLFNYFITGIYFVSFWYYFNSTPGKMFMHIKIVDIKTLESPSLLQCVKRFLCYLTALLGMWSIIFSQDRRALHDKLSNTLVIKS